MGFSSSSHLSGVEADQFCFILQIMLHFTLNCIHHFIQDSKNANSKSKCATFCSFLWQKVQFQFLMWKRFLDPREQKLLSLNGEVVSGILSCFMDFWSGYFG